MQAMKGVQMRKLCDKNCGTCDLEKCLLKNPPYDWKVTESHRTEKSREQRRNYVKRKREICIAFGVCRECMAKDAVVGNYCVECFVKNKRRNELKRKDFPRSERPAYGKCYFCGKPVERGFKTCKKCHENIKERVMNRKINNSGHIWRNMNKLIFQRTKQESEVSE